MDRSIQLLITVVSLILSFSSYSQCSDSVVVYQDSCGNERVSSSMEIFSSLYLSKKNLDILSKELPNVKKITDSLHKAEADRRAILMAEIETHDYKNSILELSLEDATKTMVEMDIDNLYLKHKVNKMQKQQKRIFGVGISVGVIGTVVLLNAIK